MSNKESKSIATTVFSQSDSEVVINACKKQRADGMAKKDFPDFAFDGLIESRGSGDNLYRYINKAAQNVEQNKNINAAIANAPAKPKKTKTPKAPKPAVAATTDRAPRTSADDVYSMTKEERKAVTDEEAKNMTLTCTRQITPECIERGGGFTPKGWNVRQNYRVCRNCQNTVNKKYRPEPKGKTEKAETATA